ncbi:transmembrane amino acid transporter family protein [Aspergillus sclerotiicarbonarius CBS 121057]|uniref:Transmembrane amino acid transporter family protein n=1 Tax=Aspergillus sclerotiicarbonarius (strain CBS 121057 / IBT 28362) TaxID=1448318 RepID=A0A319DZ66_ASPSB|nr:transmembrane amino acid transporter family protein [Aspergillus sclerotiicarbonarius CBS 121057]PYI03102.1 transmembrane amino acid transporter family protein [Aspergillus sclerotiicarbonarius CBS 121057]
MASEIEPAEVPPTMGVLPSYTEAEENRPRRMVPRADGALARLDPSVTLEEYMYWANIEREMEEEENRQYVEERGPLTVGKVIKGRFSKGVHHENEKKKHKEDDTALQVSGNEKSPEGKEGTPSDSSLAVSDEEWRTAARALRTASWGTIFYLITTDVLGWANAPFVFASVGYGPAVALFIVFGCFAGFSGWILWKVFLELDSTRYPLINFGDTYYRVFGPWARHLVNVGQSLQLLMSVSVLILGNGQTLSQLANNDLCFVVCMVIMMIIGMVFGSIRSLQRLGWLTNAAVWLNIADFIMIMVAAGGHFGIDYQATISSTLIKVREPVKVFAGPPPDQYQMQATGFAGQFTGVDQMVYSYGGAILFVSFLAEMRRPWDFWKGLLCAQLFICFVYIFFGAFVYSFYGQYSISNIYNVVQPKGLQTAVNIVYFLTCIIACILYFNIGMKSVYQQIFMELLNFPDISTFRGRLLWYGLGPIYWAIAFVIAGAVPNLSGISSMVGAALILNFTYTLPGILYVGFRTQKDAVLPGEGYNPVTGVTTRHDEGWKRYVRGFKKSLYINLFCIFYFCGGLACSGMGMWAAITSLIEIFAPGGTVATSFGCAAPV